MCSELKSKLADWAWLLFGVTVVTYLVTLPLVWFGCAFWVGMAYRESTPPPDLLQAQFWREFIRAELSLPLALWPWFAFVLGVIALGVISDIRAHSHNSSQLTKKHNPS